MAGPVWSIQSVALTRQMICQIIADTIMKHPMLKNASAHAWYSICFLKLWWELISPREKEEPCNKPSANQGGGVVATPPYGFSRSLQNAKESDLLYILFGHFDEKKMGVPPYPGVG